MNIHEAHAYPPHFSQLVELLAVVVSIFEVMTSDEMLNR